MINRDIVPMEIDTVISGETYKKKKQPTLNPSKTELYIYTGDRLNVCGSIDVKVNYISYH